MDAHSIAASIFRWRRMVEQVATHTHNASERFEELHLLLDVCLHITHPRAPCRMCTATRGHNSSSYFLTTRNPRCCKCAHILVGLYLALAHQEWCVIFFLFCPRRKSSAAGRYEEVAATLRGASRKPPTSYRRHIARAVGVFMLCVLLSFHVALDV